MQQQMERLNSMQNAFNQQQMQPQQIQQQTQQVTPVGGIEEVKAHPIDWTGNVSYFIDKANNKIYTKQLGNDGIPKISSYVLDENPQQERTTGEFVSKQEFNLLKQEIEQYKGILNNFLGGNANVQQSTTVNTNDDAGKK